MLAIRISKSKQTKTTSSKPEKWYFLETVAEGLKNWLPLWEGGFEQAILLVFHSAVGVCLCTRVLIPLLLVESANCWNLYGLQQIITVSCCQEYSPMRVHTSVLHRAEGVQKPSRPESHGKKSAVPRSALFFELHSEVHVQARIAAALESRR